MTHTDLIARLEKATGADRELDVTIWLAIVTPDVWSYDDNSHIEAQIRNGLWDNTAEEHPDYHPTPQKYWRYKIGEYRPDMENGDVPLLTSSLDAAVSLAERVLPDFTAWEISSRGAKTRFTGGIFFTKASVSKLADDGDELSFECATAATPAIAMCIAILKAVGEGAETKKEPQRP
jgi:hypothetical protein